MYRLIWGKTVAHDSVIETAEGERSDVLQSYGVA
jgi:hypothetical protein